MESRDRIKNKFVKIAQEVIAKEAESAQGSSNVNKIKHFTSNDLHSLEAIKLSEYALKI